MGASSVADAALRSWSFSPGLVLVLLVAAALYVRGWRRLRALRATHLPVWRLAALLTGLGALAVALLSPLDAFAGLLLTAHMAQHLLLMAVAPFLILLGAPIVPLLCGLPLWAARDALGPFLAWPPLHRFARALTHPVVGWLAMTAAMVGWHLPFPYQLALRSPSWHEVEHACFLVSSLLFWWSVLRPWPSRAHWSAWTIPPFLLAGDIVNTALAAFLTFYDRLLYPVYASVPRLFGLSAQDDQVLAGALMWVAGSMAFLGPAVVITWKLLSPRLADPARRVSRPPTREHPPAASQVGHRATARENPSSAWQMAHRAPAREHLSTTSQVEHRATARENQSLAGQVAHRATARENPSSAGQMAHRAPAREHLPTTSQVGHRAPAGGPLPLAVQAGHRPVPTSPARFDLLRAPLIGPLLRARYGRRALQAVLLLLALLVVADGLFGHQMSGMNLAGVLPWTYWRALTVVALLAAGNLFCMACPFMLPRELARRLGKATRQWPRALRSKWVAVALLVLFFWAYEAFSIWDSPLATAWIIVAYFAAAFTVDALFRGASFCKYVCPIGQFHFVSSLVSPLEVKVRRPDACATCTTHDCLRGNERQRGCELDLYLPQKVGNLDCTFCLDCVKACPHDNIGIVLLAPGHDLRSDPRRSSLGRLSLRPDIAALALVFVFASLVNAAAMVAPVTSWRDQVTAGLGIPSTFPATTAILLAGLVLAPAILVPAVVGAGRRLSGSARSGRELFCRLSLALVPLGLSLWAAHFLFHLFSGWGTAWPTFQRAAADFGGTVLGIPSFRMAAPLLAANRLLAIELLLLDAGLLLSLYLGWGIARACAPSLRAALGLVAPWAGLAVAFYVAGVWVLFQPMQMRGMVH